MTSKAPEDGLAIPQQTPDHLLSPAPNPHCPFPRPVVRPSTTTFHLLSSQGCLKTMVTWRCPLLSMGQCHSQRPRATTTSQLHSAGTHRDRDLTMTTRQDHLDISLLAGIFPSVSWLTVVLLSHTLLFLLMLSSVGLSLLFCK